MAELSVMDRINMILSDPEKATMTLAQIVSEEIREFKASPEYAIMLEAESYYRNRSDVQRKTVDVANRSNTKIEHPILKKLVDQKANYLLSKPWTVDTKNSAYGEALTKVFDQTFRRKIKSLGKGAIKSGIAWIQPYFRDGKLAFMRIPSTELVPLWRDAERTELDAFIRFYDQVIYIGTRKHIITHAEFWWPGGVKWFKTDAFAGTGARNFYVDKEHGDEASDYNVTGAAFDITTLVSGAKWSTKRSGSPASLELTAIVNDEIQWSHGGIVTLLDDKTGLFYGYVVKISQNEKEQVQITAYDQTWYLKKNKDTYVFKGKRADQVLKQIAEDFKLKTGSLANTGYSIPSMIEDGQTLFDIVLKAIDYTLINTGKMFVLWDNFGKLTLTDVETAKLDLFVGDGSLATGFTYESEIDSEAYNKIKLVKDNKKTGKRDVYIFQDSKNMTLWGILQDYEVVDEDMNEAQIKKRGGQMLELYNRPKRSFSVSAIADLSVRAGRALYIGIGAVGVKSFFIVEEATHDLLKETMSLKLKVV